MRHVVLIDDDIEKVKEVELDNLLLIPTWCSARAFARVAVNRVFSKVGLLEPL